MRKVWLQGVFLRKQGKHMWVIKFDGKKQPSYVKEEYILNTDVYNPKLERIRGFFQVPEWLAEKEELVTADLRDY